MILIIKGNHINTISERVFFLPTYIEERFFTAALLNCNIVLLNYPISFQYRVSGIFFECLANSIPLIVSNINSFVQYADNFNYNPFYNDLNQLYKTIEYLINVEKGFSPYKNLETIEPNLGNIEKML